jgi:hypothetical protein
MYTYEIIKQDKNDTQATVIKKSGITTEFSLKDIYDHKLKVEQDLREKKGQVDIAKASMKNITTNHEVIRGIIDDIKAQKNSRGILATLYMYIKHDIDRDTNQRMVKEREALLKEYDEELDVIHEQLSIPKPVKVEYVKAK